MSSTGPIEEKPAPCATCKMRARYERNPRSLLGRFWLWHTRWCPGWKAYVATLPESERANLNAGLHR
jgi:hypothetical protein